MTQLKQRLQQVLDARLARDARGTHELQLPLRSVSAAPRRKAPAAGARAGTEPAWGYGGSNGPARWGELDPAWSLCARGRRQSPIDLRDGIAVDLQPVRFDYRPGGFEVVDTGRTVRVDLDAGSAIEVGGRRYALQQLQFRRPSEERVDGRQSEMSVQMLHRDADGRIAIVAVLLDEGPALPLVQQVWADLPLERDLPVPGSAAIDPAGLLPPERGYATYLGSLTTPPCTEGVLWIVMRQPMTASRAQIDIFARLYPMNARPLQDAAGRLIKQSAAAD
ncbi:MAG: carbonic anhydrase family protein [Burkholderiales bacterium]|nr:carbonic anhydrase family protein [Burkholderiales bacterium]